MQGSPSSRSSLASAPFYSSGPVKIILGISIGLLTTTLTLWPLQLGLLHDIELFTIDHRFQQRGVQGDLHAEADVVIVEINDDDQQDLLEPFPFPRWYYAHLIENLNRAGARIIALDLTFERATPADSALRTVLARYDNVVLAVKDQEAGQEGLFSVRRQVQDYNNVFFDVNPLVGVVNVLSDRDGVIRRYAPLWNVGGHLTPTFAFAVVAHTLGFSPGSTAGLAKADYFTLNDLHIPRFDESTYLLNYYGPVRTFRYVPFSQVIDDDRFQTRYEAEEGEEDNLFDEGMMSLFKDKIVLVGSTMAEDRDIHNAPLYDPAASNRSNALYGIEIHATAIQNLLDRRFIRRLPRVLEGAVLPLLSLLTFVVLIGIRQRPLQPAALLELGAVGLTLLLLFALYGSSRFAFEQQGLLIPLVGPGLTILAAMVGGSAYVFLLERQQKALIKGAFSRYVSPAVVNDLIAHPDKIALGGERRELTVLFTDIADFTSLSEGLDPEELVHLLNEYFGAMTECIFNHEGTVDKFIGDAIMALWGAPVRLDDHGLQACRAALAMQDQLEGLRRTWQAAGKTPLKARCGINTGPMVVGNMGGEARFDYTVIGDSVNLASRLESACKLYGTRIVISEFTYTHVQEQVLVRELDLVRVKGKTNPITIYELIATADQRIPADKQQVLDLYTRGLQHYKQRDWATALDHMQRAYDLDPHNRPAALYIQRAQAYLQHPPPASWDGIFQMTTK